jgi:hypothetical protein
VQRDQQDALQFWLALLDAVTRITSPNGGVALPAATPDFNGPAMADRVLSELADACSDIFGYDRHDPASWAEKRIRLSSRSRVNAQTFAPAAWGAAMDLVGGEGRVTLPWQWGNGFIANLGVGMTGRGSLRHAAWPAAALGWAVLGQRLKIMD